MLRVHFDESSVMNRRPLVVFSLNIFPRRGLSLLSRFELSSLHPRPSRLHLKKVLSDVNKRGKKKVQSIFYLLRAFLPASSSPARARRLSCARLSNNEICGRLSSIINFNYRSLRSKHSSNGCKLMRERNVFAIPLLKARIIVCTLILTSRSFVRERASCYLQQKLRLLMFPFKAIMDSGREAVFLLVRQNLISSTVIAAISILRMQRFPRSFCVIRVC